jgi:hypothetical protein
MKKEKLEVLKRMGYTKQSERIQQDLCPSCGKFINPSDFKDDLSRREFRLSGMCQKCQDETFG